MREYNCFGRTPMRDNPTKGFNIFNLNPFVARYYLYELAYCISSFPCNTE